MRTRTIITGATSGIGFELPAQLAGAGVAVIANGRQPQRLAALAALSSRIEPLTVDLTDRHAVGAAIATITARYSASTAGLQLFTDALRVQTRGMSVRVVEALMPLVDTPMTHGRGRGKIAASDAAAQLIRGVALGHAEVRVGKARALPHLQRWAPSLLARLTQATS